MKVLIVESHGNLREFIAGQISENFPLLEISQAEDLQSALDIIRFDPPDVVASCIHMREHNDGFILMRRIKETNPFIKVVLFSNFIGDNDYRPDYLVSIGAIAAIPKSLEVAADLANVFKKIL